MSAISSFTSPSNLYQHVDRNSLAQSAEAVAGTKQAFAETDEEASHGGHRHGHNPGESVEMAETQNTATDSPYGNHQHILNVTA